MSFIIKASQQASLGIFIYFDVNTIISFSLTEVFLRSLQVLKCDKLLILKMQSPQAKQLSTALQWGEWLILHLVFGGGKFQ